MKYFSALPKVVSTDINGNNQILTNLLVRVNVIPDLLKNPLLFYSYDIKDGETPEKLRDRVKVYMEEEMEKIDVLFENGKIKNE